MQIEGENRSSEELQGESGGDTCEPAAQAVAAGEANPEIEGCSLPRRDKSTHKVEVVRIDAIERHPNADKLGVVRVWGYVTCVRLDQFKVGDLGAYIVPDSIVPNTPEFAFLKGDNRIRVVRLRGHISQGLMVPAPPGSQPGDDVAEILGVTRYEPPGLGMQGGEATRGPYGDSSKYDVDSWHRWGSLLIPGEEVVITEKLHGQSARYCWSNGEFFCGSRTEWKKYSAENIFWGATRSHPWIEEFCRNNPGLVLYGEVYGEVRGMSYGIARGALSLRFAAFDLYKPMELKWFDVDEALTITEPYGVEWVPTLYRGPYSEDVTRSFSVGNSIMPGADHMREGCVIRPVKERRDPEAGRVIFKIVSDEYLASS